MLASSRRNLCGAQEGRFAYDNTATVLVFAVRSFSRDQLGCHRNDRDDDLEGVAAGNNNSGIKLAATAVHQDSRT